MKRTNRVAVTMYGEPPGEIQDKRVSGLLLFQRLLLQRLEQSGLVIVEYYFQQSRDKIPRVETLSETRRLVHMGTHVQPFWLEKEGGDYGLDYPESARALKDALLDDLHTSGVIGICIIEWMSSGMVLWDTALQFPGQTVFLPTEQGAVCHLGFLLNPDGSACSGPEDGAKCAQCTHGVEPFPLTTSLAQQWYSRRFQLFHSLTSWMPQAVQYQSIWQLANIFTQSSSRLNNLDAQARVASARRFLSQIHAVTFQSDQQKRTFERALNISLPKKFPTVIPPNRFLEYDPIQDVRAKSAGGKPLIFLFAARSGFDRGLGFLLDVWEKWAPDSSIVRLIVRTSREGDWVDKRVSDLINRGCDVDLRYGVLSDDNFLNIVTSVHFIVNPAMWEEPLAGTVIEGLCLGTPAIVPTETGSACFVAHGVNGYHYTFRDHESLLHVLMLAVSEREKWKALHGGALDAWGKYEENIKKYMDALIRIFR